ncbi:MAG: hypothetical protein LIO44_02790 [Eubacterium sp.]|nr:hypothetical protein [Eubacterium sp.]
MRGGDYRCFTCSMIFSFCAAFIYFVSTPAIVNRLGAEGYVNSSARSYLKIIVLDMPFLFMINLYSAINQAQRNTVTQML